MRKLLWVPITVIASILLLEGIWFNRVRQEYQDKTMIKVEKLLSVSIGKELTLRDYGYPEDPQNHRFVYKVQDSLPAEARMTGDTLNVDMLAEKHIGKEFHEIVQQISQDLDIDKGKYLLLSNLDSIFRAELETEGVNVDYRLSWYDHDTTAIQTAGTLSASYSPSHSHETSKTRLFPIGTRGLQFVDAEVDIHLSLFMKQMLYLLLLSGVLAVVVMGCVVYLLVTIRRKNRLFRQREASVNGTVHDLKAPLNSIVALMGLLKRHVTAETDRALIEKTSAQARSLVGEIEELLITARRDRQRLYIQKKEVDLLALIRTACASVEAQYEAKPHHICIEAETESVSLYADGLYVTNVIRNLIENALKYSDDGVEVRIRAVSGKDFTELVVEDTGWELTSVIRRRCLPSFSKFLIGKKLPGAAMGWGLLT
ncbi:MAG: sensor histidine kinase [Phocaeicola sp.]